MILNNGKTGEIYNIGTKNECTNLEITQILLDLTGNDASMIDWVEDRLNHDRRYSVDSSKIESLGWTQEISFDNGISDQPILGLPIFTEILALTSRLHIISV